MMVFMTCTLVYRNERRFGANTLFARSFALVSSNPNVAGGSPITISPNAFRTQLSTVEVGGGSATFSNTVNFWSSSSLYLDGSNCQQCLNIQTAHPTFMTLCELHPSSTLFVDGLSYFTEDVQIDA